jgi:hypothetical protein
MDIVILVLERVKTAAVRGCICIFSRLIETPDRISERPSQLAVFSFVVRLSAFGRHLATFRRAAKSGRYWMHSGHWPALALNG